MPKDPARGLLRLIPALTAIELAARAVEQRRRMTVAQRRHKYSKASSRDFRIREELAMRVLILAISVLGVLVSMDAAGAGPSTVDRELVASVEPAALTNEATQETEDQIGLDKAKRRDVQRWLTRLGFDTRVNGTFDDNTRAVIMRWQAARGYPRSGYLDTRQHQALLAEDISAAHSDSVSSDNRGSAAETHRHRNGGGGPGGLIGSMVGGLFGRR